MVKTGPKISVWSNKPSCSEGVLGREIYKLDALGVDALGLLLRVFQDQKWTKSSNPVLKQDYTEVAHSLGTRHSIVHNDAQFE